MTEEEMEKLHYKNRDKLFKDKSDSEIQDILTSKIKKLNMDLTLEGFGPLEVAYIFEESLELVKGFMKRSS